MAYSQLFGAGKALGSSGFPDMLPFLEDVEYPLILLGSWQDTDLTDVVTGAQGLILFPLMTRKTLRGWGISREVSGYGEGAVTQVR